MVFLANKQYFGLGQQKAGQAQRINVPAPSGGLNTRDAESIMAPNDAIIMENWFPGQGSVSTRRGSEDYATGLTGNVETLMEFNSGSTRKFLCANSDEINDITNPLSISNVGSGFSNARWQTVNFNAYILLFNGADTPQLFDGTTLSSSTINGSGLTPANLNGVNIHKNRVYTWETGEPDFWYGATNAIQGTFTKFPLSSVVPFGGNLIAMGTLNHDGGDGVDDYAVFFMSSGDVAVYAGSDPGDSSWSLIGIFRIGAPFSVRAIQKVGGDLIVITDQGFVFFSEVFRAGGLKVEENKLSGAAIEAVQNFQANYGWEVSLYPRASDGSWLIFNVPNATNSVYTQYIVNTVNGAATKFTGMNARTWGLFNNELYFGESGKVMKADSGLDDDGNFIVCDVQAAYSDFGIPQEKVVNSFRNTIKLDGNVSLNTIVNFDYGQEQTTQTVSTASEGVEWDTAFWDTVLWSPENQTRNELVISSGEGVALGMRINVSLKGQQLFWFRTDYSFNINNYL